MNEIRYSQHCTRLLGLTLLMLSMGEVRAEDSGAVDGPTQGQHVAQRLNDVRSASAAAPAPSAYASPSSNGLRVTVPNGYATVTTVDLRLQSVAGELRWTRTWDGQEWKFNSHWESLSQSWKNLTGSQSADTTGGTISGASSSVQTASDSGGGGCWVWVDEDWAPSVGTTEIGGIPQHGPMAAARTLPFNRVMGEGSTDYPPPQRVNVDYASLCAGRGMDSSPLRDAEGIRRINELYLGEEGRYAFSNRSILEKRSVRQLTQLPAATLEADIADGRFDALPEENPKGYRWLDRSGDWIEYNTQGQIVAYGDRNDNAVWLARDTDGRVRAAIAAGGRVLLSLHYNGELLSSIKDYPQGIAQELPSRSVSYEYDGANRLIRVVDARGNATRYEYDVANRLVKIIDAEEREELLAYTSDVVSRHTAADGAVTDYLFDYDDVNKQFTSRITGPETTAGRRVEAYTHNRVGKLVSYIVNGRTEEEVRYDTGARVEIATNARGFTTRTTRDEFDQITEITHPDGSVSKFSYSALNLQLVEETDEAGVKTRYELDAKGNRIKVVQAFGTSAERIVEYLRNGQGQVTRITHKGRVEADQSVSQDAVWQIEYDELGQTRRTVDPEGHVRQYVYDRAGNLLQYTNARGYVTRYEVDASGNLLRMVDALGRTSSYSYDKVGNQVGMTDARNALTRIEYDAMNRKTRVITPLQGVFNVQYNGQGLPIIESDEDGRSNQIEYDNFLRISRQVDPLGNTTRFAYEVADGSSEGAVGSLTEPTEIVYPTYTHQIRFDTRERPTSQTVLNETARGLQTLTGTNIYDSKGRIVSATDAEGRTRTHRYDAFGQLIESTDALAGKTSSLYDVHGNRIQFTDAKGNRYGFEYDRNRRLIRQSLPLGQVTASNYDTHGNLAETNGPLGQRTVYVYDAANRLIEARYYKSGGALVRSRTQTWDDNDNLIAWTDTDLTRPAAQPMSGSASYDAANRKIGERVNYPDARGGSFTLSYGQTFSLAGKKTGLIWADGTAIAYGYSPLGELMSVSIPGEGTISVDRFNWGNPEKIDFPGGGSQTRSYDGLFNIEGLTVQGPSQNTVFNLSNQFGRILELQNSTRVDTIAGQSTSTSYAYDYDLENHLIRVQTDTDALGQTVNSLTLDAVGNRISASSEPGPWSYDANNRLTKRGDGVCGAAGTVCYDYDDAGNLSRKTDGGRVTHYVFDTANRLVEVLDGASNPIARYGYDSLDRRTWKEQYRDAQGNLLARAQRSYYLYADEGLIAEATQDIQLQIDSSVTTDSHPVIAVQYGIKPESEFSTGALFIKSGNDYAYYVHDQLNKPVQAVDKNGDVVWSARYDAFGKASIMTQTVTSNLRLPGQYADAETGLHYNLRRYYDPETGRYLSQDPLGIDGGSNLYLYAMADPVNVTDARGEVPAIVLVPVAFCARFPRVCQAAILCLTNPSKCRKGFCKVIHAVYKPACNVPGCKPGDGPGTTQFKAAAAEACVVGRTVARVVCFGSDKSTSGENHENEAKKAQQKFQECVQQMNKCPQK